MVEAQTLTSPRTRTSDEARLPPELAPHRLRGEARVVQRRRQPHSACPPRGKSADEWAGSPRRSTATTGSTRSNAIGVWGVQAEQIASEEDNLRTTNHRILPPLPGEDKLMFRSRRTSAVSRCRQWERWLRTAIHMLAAPAVSRQHMPSASEECSPRGRRGHGAEQLQVDLYTATPVLEVQKVNDSLKWSCTLFFNSSQGLKPSKMYDIDDLQNNIYRV
ncbi:hypothetical protein SETIT_1G343900v2 [Setaria italica]|uniref:Uncharacterized protein n=1 Tax=Setaria italica TaxID=4555 RepID=A0A368PSM7_SETIT|nr:hypothetical protein SETIT_1G343900v2 [Setaria italica]